jgi:hypothetical protein
MNAPIFRSKWLIFTPAEETPFVSSVSALPPRSHATAPMSVKGNTTTKYHSSYSYAGMGGQGYPTDKTDKSPEASRGLLTRADCPRCGGALAPYLVTLPGRGLALLCPACRRWTLARRAA